MRGMWKCGAAIAAIAAVPVGVAAQTAPASPQASVPRAQTAPASPQASVPQVQTQAQPASAADPLSAIPAPEEVAPPPLFWTVQDAMQLKAFIEGIGAEGLDPLDYDPLGLSAALASGDPVRVSAAASERFNKLSSDLAFGHVRGEARGEWLINDKADLDAGRQYLLMKAALEQHRVADALRGLLPTHPQYGDLRNALAKTPATDTVQIDRLKLNMDRWRWLPRELGEKYIIVNVPAYYVALVENGTTIWRERAVAGAKKTPTPMLSATATGVILNPWWEVPKSIEGEVRGKAGFVPVKGKDGKIQRWRQPPGPSNALGQLKFVMPNPEAIYLHDTNARSRFNDQIRSLSHGCIRTKDVVGLAKTIMADEANPTWDSAKIDETLASKKTVEAKFVTPIPVYIVYFSAAAATDGRIVTYNDVYKRDARVIAALNDRPSGTVVAATKTAGR